MMNLQTVLIKILTACSNKFALNKIGKDLKGKQIIHLINFLLHSVF